MASYTVDKPHKEGRPMPPIIHREHGLGEIQTDTSVHGATMRPIHFKNKNLLIYVPVEKWPELTRPVLSVPEIEKYLRSIERYKPPKIVVKVWFPVKKDLTARLRTGDYLELLKVAKQLFPQTVAGGQPIALQSDEKEWFYTTALSRCVEETSAALSIDKESARKMVEEAVAHT